MIDCVGMMMAIMYAVGKQQQQQQQQQLGRYGTVLMYVHLFWAAIVHRAAWIPLRIVKQKLLLLLRMLAEDDTCSLLLFCFVCGVTAFTFAD